MQIRGIEARDPVVMSAAFTAVGWNKPVAQYERYLREQEQGDRVVLVAFLEEVFAGYLCVVWQPRYSPFREAGVPEIQDFNVVSHFRRQGIGTRLMEAAEALASERSPVVGIGVGMTADYGAAQRLYVRRGYIPDGQGLTSDNRPLVWGEQVIVNDDLVLHFTKRLAR